MSPNPQPVPAPPAADPALDDYYADRRTLWRNLGLIMACNLGWNVVFQIITPLMQLRLNDAGLGAGALGTIGAANSYLVAYLVMYFSWRSDHTVSRFGRRVPYLLVSAPFIIASVMLFPWYDALFSLVILYGVQLLFMDMKASTFPLLSIDCVPRQGLARFNSIFGIVGGLVGWATMRWGFSFADSGHETATYLVGGAVMVATTALAILIREPPIRNPTSEGFKPWSALKVGWADPRVIWLMVGVAMVNSMNAMFSTWIWLYARNDLHLERSMIGSALQWAPLVSVALAFPVGWLVDRVRGLGMVVVFWVLLGGVFVLSMRVHDQASLVAASLMQTLAGGFAVSAWIRVVRLAPPKDVGSFTSSNSLIANLWGGTLVTASGWLIQANGDDYRTAFILGIACSTAGLGLIIFHHLVIMRPARPQAALPVAAQPAGSPG